MIRVIIKYVLKMYGKGICLVFVLFIFSCNTEGKVSIEENTTIGQIENVNSDVLSAHMNNPAIFLGSSFGEFIQILHKTGEYEQMLTYTSRETRNNFSNNELLNFYTNMNFSFQLKLKTFKDSTLYYQTSIDATIRTIQMPIVIENDTCRIVFKNLNFEKPFIGM